MERGFVYAFGISSGHGEESEEAFVVSIAMAGPRLNGIPRSLLQPEADMRDCFEDGLTGLIQSTAKDVDMRSQRIAVRR